MYNKQAFTIDEQIERLKERGLIINDSDNAKHYLSHISYYRLAGYMKYLLNVVQPENHFTERLEDFLTKYPNADPKALGLKENWQDEFLWRQ